MILYKIEKSKSQPGYCIERKDRNRNGGGVCVFISDSLSFNRRLDLEVEDLETVAIEVLLTKTKPILVLNCYRPLTDNHFYDKLENCFLSSDKFYQQDCFFSVILIQMIARMQIV